MWAVAEVWIAVAAWSISCTTALIGTALDRRYGPYSFGHFLCIGGAAGFLGFAVIGLVMLAGVTEPRTLWILSGVVCSLVGFLARGDRGLLIADKITAPIVREQVGGLDVGLPSKGNDSSPNVVDNRTDGSSDADSVSSGDR